VKELILEEDCESKQANTIEDWRRILRVRAISPSDKNVRIVFKEFIIHLIKIFGSLEGHSSNVMGNPLKGLLLFQSKSKQTSA
jgi:hypothetical protein